MEIKKLTVFIILKLIIMTNTSTLTAQYYKADPEKSVLEWTGRKVVGKHYGEIALKEGEFTVEDNSITSGSFIIEMSSIRCDDLTGATNERLVGHLKSDDFFSTDKFPYSTLKIIEGGVFKDNRAEVKGELTIKDSTHPVTFTVTREDNIYSAIVNVDRTLYSVRYGSGKFFDNLGDNMIDDNFTLKVKIYGLK